MSEFNLNYRGLNEKFRSTKNFLEHVCVLLAFINTYGPLYDETYYDLIKKLYSVTQDFLETMEPKPIYLIYIDYSNVKNDKSEIEILNVIKNSLNQYDRNRIK